MDFSDALRALKDGKRVKRLVWDAVGDNGWPTGYDYLELRDDGGYDILMPTVFLRGGARTVFQLSPHHVLAEDWEIVP